MKEKHKARAVGEFDIEVGQKIRARRIMLGMSQEFLGAKLGITFQQCQKYEKGTNRVSVGRIRQMLEIFDVPASYFFDEARSDFVGLSKKAIEVASLFDNMEPKMQEHFRALARSSANKSAA